MVFTEHFKAHVESLVTVEPQTAAQIYRATDCWAPTSVRNVLRELSNAGRIKTELRHRGGDNYTRFYWAIIRYLIVGAAMWNRVLRQAGASHGLAPTRRYRTFGWKFGDICPASLAGIVIVLCSIFAAPSAALSAPTWGGSGCGVPSNVATNTPISPVSQGSSRSDSALAFASPNCNSRARCRSSAFASLMLSDQNWMTVNMTVAAVAAAATAPKPIIPFHERSYHQSANSGDGNHDIEARTYQLGVFLWVVGCIAIATPTGVAIFYIIASRRCKK